MEAKVDEEKIKGLIIANKAHEAIAELAKSFSGTDIGDDLIGIQSRLNLLEREEVNRTSDRNSLAIARNNLNFDIIKILNRAKNAGLGNGSVISVVKHEFEIRNEDIINDYIENRVRSQMEWYSHKSAWSKRLFLKRKITVIACLTAIVLSAGFKMNISEVEIKPLVTGMLGVVVLLLEFKFLLNNYEREWHNYRAKAARLSREINMFLNKASYYQFVENPTNVFIVNIESIVNEE